MKAEVALQAMFDRFVGRFVLPLSEGGRALVSFPIGPAAQKYFEQAPIVDDAIERSLALRRGEALRPLLERPPWFEKLGRDERYLLVALHDVLLTSHDDIVGGLRGGKRWETVASWAESALDRVSRCESVETAFERHSVLASLHRLRRIDVAVTTRFGTKLYRGEPPPKRALAFPRLRRVKVSEVSTPLGQVVVDDRARKIFHRLLTLSPLTSLLWRPQIGTERSVPAPLRWTPELVRVLSRRDVCRAVTYQHLEWGLSVVGPRLAEGLLQTIEGLTSGGSEAELAAATFGVRYVVNLHLTRLWSVQDEGLYEPFDEPWPARDRGERKLFFAWVAASLARPDRFGAPPPPDLIAYQREQIYCQRASEVAGELLGDVSKTLAFLAPTTVTRAS